MRQLKKGIHKMYIDRLKKLNPVGKMLSTLILLCIFYIGVSGKTDLKSFYGSWQGTSPGVLVEQGVKAIKKGDMELALMFFNMAIRNYDKDASDDDQRSYVKAYLNAGAIYYAEYTDNQQAYNCWMNALEISHRLGVNDYDGYIYTNIGSICSDMKAYGSATKYYFKALSGSLKSKNWYVASVAATNIFFDAIKNNQAGYCRRVAGMLDSVSIPDSDPNGRYLNTTRKMLHAVTDGRYGEAIAETDLLIKHTDSKVYEEPVRLIVMLRQNKAYIYSLTGEYDEGLRESRICETLISKNGIDKSEMSEVYELMSKLYHGKGEQVQAYTYLKKAGACMEDSETRNHHTKISAMQAMYKLNQKNAEMDAMTRESNLRNLIMSVLVVAFVGLAAVLVVMYRNSRQLKHKNRLIYTRTMNLLDKSKADYRLIMEYESRIAACNAEIESLKSTAKTEPAEPPALTAETEKPPAMPTGSGEAAPDGLPDTAAYNIMSKVFAVMEDGDDIFTPDFSIDKLAATVGSKPKYVSQAINSCCKKNFRTLLSEYRIREVCKRFSEKEKYGDYTIEATAMSVGFNSRSAFIAAFKRVMGITPSEYMKSGLAHKA